MTFDDESEDLRTHVAVCAERYQNLHHRLSRLEKLVMGSSTAIIAGMISVVVALVGK
jgi:hypothetical protein